ncbi:MAG TPA: DUF120 domain-containing protein [Candidatus Eisenbacteria bacterium]|nr:DUF120 domain-containing protein [Candidatus Eisenbacteria bacterium]
MREEHVARQATLNGVVFSDLGRASSFMALEWVRQALRDMLGFEPYPATLNLRPLHAEDARAWRSIRERPDGMRLMAAHDFCNARLFPAIIRRLSSGAGTCTRGAVLLPEVANYPIDKIEVIAPDRLKDAWGLADGDRVTLELLS